MPNVLHSWRTENDDPTIEKWFVYASSSVDSKGQKVAEVPYSEDEAEFELTEGTWYLRVLGRLKDGSEHDWQTAFVAKEVIDAQAQPPPSVNETDETVVVDLAPAVAEIAPQRSVSITVDPQPRDEAPAKVQIIQGDDPDTGKLIAEVTPPPRGPVGEDGSRQASPPIPVEGLARAGNRRWTMRSMTKGGIPAESADTKQELAPPSPEQIHYPVTIASVVPGTATNMIAASGRGYTFDATHGVLLDAVPEIASLLSIWGSDISSGLLASLPAFSPYVNRVKILTDVYDLGADAVPAPYMVDCHDDLQRYSVNGWDAVIDIAGLSPYPFHPASEPDVRPLPSSPAWAAREVMTSGRSRQPLRNWRWQVFTHTSLFVPTSVPDASWINHVPGRIYDKRYIAARLVIEEPISWWRLKVPNLSVRVLFQSALGADASGTPEARVARPPGSVFVDTATGKVYTKTTGVGTTGWVEMGTAAAAGGVPTGTILDHAAVLAPTGYLLCDGTSYPTATYPALFAVIGYVWGGAGANFNVPDLRDRFAQGLGPSNGIASTGGAVSPTVTNPTHTHPITPVPVARTAGGVATATAPVVTGNGTQNTSIADARPPFATVQKIIKT